MFRELFAVRDRGRERESLYARAEYILWFHLDRHDMRPLAHIGSATFVQHTALWFVRIESQLIHARTRTYSGIGVILLLTLDKLGEWTSESERIRTQAERDGDAEPG